MRIFITCPNINARHGGIRVILEIAHRLKDFGHDVFLFNQAKGARCDWYSLTVQVVSNTALLKSCDVLLVCSPHASHLLEKPYPAKKVIHLQAMEHLFFPGNTEFERKCRQCYQSPYPMITISKWMIQDMRHLWGRTGETFYIGNGINLDHFPISRRPKDSKVVLLESPEPGNRTKDVDRLALRVGERLAEMGYNVIGYGAKMPTTWTPPEFHMKPDLATMNSLYERASIMVKATVLDCRSTAPIEAMTKGTVTVRGIVKGDDDLTEENSIRCGYDFDELYQATMKALTMDLTPLREACYKHVQENTWHRWMPEINKILCA